MTVVPAQTPARDVLALNPDGVFLSNGPGDPAALRLRHCRCARDHGRQDAAVRHLPGPPDHGPGLRRQDLQDAKQPPRCQPPREGPGLPAASASPARTTALRWSWNRCRPICAPRTSACLTARCRAWSAPMCPLSASRATPKHRPARTISATCSTASPALMREEALKCLSAPDHQKHSDHSAPAPS